MKIRIKQVFLTLLCMILLFTLVSCKKNELANGIVMGIICEDDGKDGLNSKVIKAAKNYSEKCYIEKNVTSDEVASAISRLVDKGVNTVVINTYNQLIACKEVANNYDKINFISFAYDNEESNMQNIIYANTYSSESLYLSGVAIGLKMKSILDKGIIKDNLKDADENIKVGFVAFNDSPNTKLNYTNFYKGFNSIVTKSIMEVNVLNGEPNDNEINDAVINLINDNCLVIACDEFTNIPNIVAEKNYSDDKPLFAVTFDNSAFSKYKNTKIAYPICDVNNAFENIINKSIGRFNEHVYIEYDKNSIDQVSQLIIDNNINRLNKNSLEIYTIEDLINNNTVDGILYYGK